MSYTRTEINNVLQQFAIKPQKPIEVNADEEFPEEVKKILEDKCCTLMDTYVSDDLNVGEVLSAVQDLVLYAKDQCPPSSEYHEVLNLILDQSSSLADKYQANVNLDIGANPPLLGTNPNAEDDSGEVALTLSEQLTATYSNNNLDSWKTCSLAAVLLSVSDAMTVLGIEEAKRLAAMNDDYVKAKEALADFQKMVTAFKTFFDTASANAKNAKGTEETTGTDKTSDWYAWLVNKNPINWEEVPLPAALLTNSSMLNTFKTAIDGLIKHYYDFENKDFQNFLQKNGGMSRDEWLKQSIQSVMKGNASSVNWGQSGDNTPNKWPNPVQVTKIEDPMNLALPIDKSLIPAIFETCIENATVTEKKGGGKSCWLTQDHFLAMEQALTTKLQGIAPSKMVDDVLGFSNAFSNVANFNALVNWMDSPLKQLSASQDALNQKLTSINDRVRNIGNTIKDNLDKVKIMI